MSYGARSTSCVTPEHMADTMGAIPGNLFLTLTDPTHLQDPRSSSRDSTHESATLSAPVLRTAAAWAAARPPISRSARRRVIGPTRLAQVRRATRKHLPLHFDSSGLFNDSKITTLSEKIDRHRSRTLDPIFRTPKLHIYSPESLIPAKIFFH